MRTKYEHLKGNPLPCSCASGSICLFMSIYRKQSIQRFLIPLLILAAVLNGAAEEPDSSSAAVDQFVSNLEPGQKPDQESGNSLSALDKFIFTVKTDHETGKAFLIKDDEGTVWMVSSSTVFEGAETTSIQNEDEETIEFPEQIQVARHSDAVRFKTGRSDGMSPAAECAFQEKLAVFSQCRNDDDKEEVEDLKEDLQELKESKENVEKFKKQMGSRSRMGRYTKADVDEALENIDEAIKEVREEIDSYEEKIADRRRIKKASPPVADGFMLSGEAVAIGPSRIELSTPINRFDGGGPVLNANQEVVGMNSYLMSGSSLPEWMIEGTRFADARQFALKLSDVEWMDISKEQYLEETEVTREMFNDLMTFAYIIARLSDYYLNDIRINTDNRAIERWIRKHNEISSKEITDDQKDFVSMIRRLEYAAGKAVQDLTIPYQQEQVQELESLYGRLRENFKQYINMQ